MISLEENTVSWIWEHENSVVVSQSLCFSMYDFSLDQIVACYIGLTRKFFFIFSPDYSKWTPNEWCHFLPWPHPSLDNSLSRCWMSLRLGCRLSTQPWQEELYANRPRWRRTGHFSRSFSGKRSPLNPIVLLWTTNNSKQSIGGAVTSYLRLGIVHKIMLKWNPIVNMQEWSWHVV